MRSRRWRLLYGLEAVLFCYLIALFAFILVEHTRDSEGMDEVLYLPNEKLLNHFTGGLNTVIADLLWLNCIQYTANEHQGQRVYTWLERMLVTSTQLDPYFSDVYYLGAMFLSALRADATASLNLAASGMVNNPHAWKLPYQSAMVYLTNRQDDPNARYMAALYLSMSLATGSAPGGIANLTAKLQDEFDLTEIEEETWRELRQSEDAFLQELAGRKLTEIELRRVCRALTEMLVLFKTQSGHPAASLEDLVEAGLIRYVPEDPLGGSFFLSPDGTVYSTTLLDDLVIRAKDRIINALFTYSERFGQGPPTLNGLVETGILKAVPDHPYPGRQWEYDPATGELL
ncbi:MAG TPA: hypothetical protein PLC40_09715 [Candidatus Hydrogenedentes bacterium]|nr:hypothetical protein [Candidatus Hydrogenedentota bacterium]